MGGERYVAWATTPCLIAYTIYSLLYQTHRGWYSFVIGTRPSSVSFPHRRMTTQAREDAVTSFVYMGGFVQLVPQLMSAPPLP